MDKLYYMGIDVGSTTVKIIVMNSNLETIYEDYQRHFSDTKNTVCNVLENLIKKADQLAKIGEMTFKKAMENGEKVRI